MTFNAPKCKVMHLLKEIIGDHQLESVESEKELGVLLSRDLKAALKS